MTTTIAPTEHKTYSIAEARNQFTSLIRTVEQNKQPLTVMRHGRPVAVILSAVEYERLINAREKVDFATAYKKFRAKWDGVEIESKEDIWATVRDQTPAPDTNPWL